MPEPWLLHRADASDLDAIMALETATFPDDAWSREGMLAELTGPHRHYLVARRPGALDAADTAAPIGGYAGLLAPRGSAQGDIQTIAVAPEHRRAGLGRMLMLALIAEARHRGVGELFLEVRADNPGAQRLYERLGFETIAVRPRYYQPAGVDAIVMRLAIPEPRIEQTGSRRAGTEQTGTEPAGTEPAAPDPTAPDDHPAPPTEGAPR